MLVFTPYHLEQTQNSVLTYVLPGSKRMTGFIIPHVLVSSKAGRLCVLIPKVS